MAHQTSSVVTLFFISVVVFKYCIVTQGLISSQHHGWLDRHVSGSQTCFGIEEEPGDERIRIKRRNRYCSSISTSRITTTRLFSTREKISRASSAPLVDSTLLRFLSKQKQMTRKRKESKFDTNTNEKEISPSCRYLVSLGSVHKPTLISVEQDPFFYRCDDDNDNDDERGKVLINSTVHTTSTRQQQEEEEQKPATSSWLTQYNSHRISQSLLLVGLDDEEMATRAGDIVQMHVLERVTRRRIRRFLRDRDRLWASSDDISKGGRLMLEVEQEEQEKEEVMRGLGLWEEDKERKELCVESIIQYLVKSGLTGRDVATIFIHTPSVSMMRVCTDDDDDYNASDRINSLESTVERTFHGMLMKTLKLRKYDARKVIRSCPDLLTPAGSRSAEEVISLLSTLGVSTSSLARDKSSLPILLSRSPSSLFRLVAFLSGDAVRMPMDSIGPFLRRNECSELLDVVAPLRKNQFLALSHYTTATQRIKQKQDLTNSRLAIDEHYRTMAQTARYLRRNFGIADLGSVLSANPKVLLLDSESDIEPVVAFMKDNIGIWEEDIPRVLQSYPALLGGSAVHVSQMEHVVSYFLSLEVSADVLGIIFRAFPSLLTLDIETRMVPVVQFLREIGVVNIGRFVTRLPPVLSYSVSQELLPKWNYLTQVIGFTDPFEVIRFPAYFSYPLERVIKARYEYLRDFKRFPSLTLNSLDDVLRFGDADFATLIAGDEDGGKAFSAYVRERGMKNKGKNELHNRKKRGNKSKRCADADGRRRIRHPKSQEKR